MRGGGYKYIPTLFDFLLSAVKYGASASDYFDYEFFDKSGAAKKKFACYGLKRKFFHTMNDYSKRHIFDNKTEFLDVFHKYAGREYLDVSSASEDQFVDFAHKHTVFMVKHPTGSCGKGIHKEKITSESDLSSIYNSLKKDKCLIEEVIVQHTEMSKLYPNCINTCRVAAIKVNGEIRILGACLRCGNGSDCIDNFCGGGVCAKIDPNTGTIISDAVNRLHQRFYKHPTTDVIFHGFVIPHWDMVIETVNNAMQAVDGVGYIGWDFAIRENDVVLIEGNFEGMFNVLQKPANKGILSEVESIIRKMKEANV